MAKGLYIGDANGKARKVKALYIGDANGKARKITKLYIGVRGVARAVYGAEGGMPTSVEALSQARSNLAGTQVGNYALFAGGTKKRDDGSGSESSSFVESYDLTLTHSILEPLVKARANLAGSHIGNYALFAGGYLSNASTYGYISDVDVYDTSLTHSTAERLSVARDNSAGTYVGNYALFGGGGKSGPPYKTGNVDVYDVSLTHSIADYKLLPFNNGAENGVGVHMGNYALMGGFGRGDEAYSSVEAFDSSLTHSSATSLSKGRTELAGSHVSNYALFGGGYNYSSKEEKIVDAYDTSLTHSIPTALSNEREKLGGAQVENYALFSGGKGYSYALNRVDTYDISLTHSVAVQLSEERYDLANAHAGDYAIFAGGYSSVYGQSSHYSEFVDAYDAGMNHISSEISSETA